MRDSIVRITNVSTKNLSLYVFCYMGYDLISQHSFAWQNFIIRALIKYNYNSAKDKTVRQFHSPWSHILTLYSFKSYFSSQFLAFLEMLRTLLQFICIKIDWPALLPDLNDNVSVVIHTITNVTK